MTAPIPAWDNGRLRPLDKLEVHRRGLRHPAVSVFVLDGPRVLLQQRALAKYHTPGLWANACCTHPHWGEAPLDCARRRLDEELGLAGLPLRHRGQVEYRADVGGGMIEHELVEMFTAEARAAALHPRPDPAEVAALRWVSLEALRVELADTPERFTPWLRIYLEDHGGAIFGHG
jgi:isopentenyl-diphosphate delta-isomerase